METMGIWAFSQMGTMASDSPVVEDPTMATTLSRSISFLAEKTAWLSSLLESSIMISNGDALDTAFFIHPFLNHEGRILLRFPEERGRPGDGGYKSDFNGLRCPKSSKTK